MLPSLPCSDILLFTIYYGRYFSLFPPLLLRWEVARKGKMSKLQWKNISTVTAWMPHAVLLVFYSLAAFWHSTSDIRKSSSPPDLFVCWGLPSARRQLLACFTLSSGTLQAVGLCCRSECHLLAFHLLLRFQIPAVVLGLGWFSDFSETHISEGVRGKGHILYEKWQ